MKQLDFTDDNEYKKNFNDVSFPSAENIIYFLKLIEKKISQQIITFYYTKFKVALQLNTHFKSKKN